MKNKILIAFCLAAIVSQSQIINTIAGGGSLQNNIPALQAELSQPSGLTIDGNGNIYFTDPTFAVVRKISTSGILSTFAGTGNTGLYSGNNGQATQAVINGPIGLVRDAAGNSYFADSQNNYIHKISPSGIITIYAGTGIAAYTGDGGPASAATFNFPQGLAIDASGNIFVADNGNNAIRKISVAGIVTTVAGNGIQGFSGDGGAATSARLNQPFGVGVDNNNEIYIADSYNFRIRKINTAGIISTICGLGFPFSSGDGGPAVSAGVVPISVFPDNTGNIYLSDYAGNKIRMINSSGTITNIAGNGTSGFSGDGGIATSAQLNFPRQVYVKADGTIYFCDGQNSRIRKISAGVITTIAGKTAPISTYALNARLEPGSVSLNRLNGKVAIADYFTYTVKVLDLSTGMLTKVAGNGVRGYSGDGGSAVNAQLDSLKGIYYDTSGIYICDGESRIRKVANNGIITTIVGNGTAGFSGDNGLAINAQINNPFSLCRYNNSLYIADRKNLRIRKVDLSTGIITTIFGNGNNTYSGDGGLAINASANNIVGIAADNNGNIYFSDVFYDVVRKINISGIVSTVAGNGTSGFSGDGGPATSAQLDTPYGLACDALGNVYINSALGFRVRKLNNFGIINTICGNGIYGNTGDGGAANLAKVTGLNGITCDANGNSIILGSGTVRMISNLQTPDICVVSTDSLSKHNIVTWEKTNYFNVDSFFIYREIGSNPSIYSKVGALPYSAYSEFIDTNKVFYSNNSLPNGDPNVSTYRYKIRFSDVNKNYSFFSKYHNTVFINDQQTGTFTWNFYDIEGSPSPITGYQLQRSNSTGQPYQIINTTSGSQNLLIDPTYSTYTATALWRVEALGFNCNPTLKLAGSFALKTRTKSNNTNERIAIGIKENNTLFKNVNIYPNPAHSIINVEFLVYNNEVYTLELTNVLGQKLQTTNIVNQKTTLTVEDLKSSIYFLNIKQNNKVIAVKKVVVE